MQSIYSYTNARRYLADFYEEQKKSRSGYSYRAFSDATNLGSPNYLKLVIDGKRNLLPHHIVSFAKTLGLSFHETEFFEALVHYTQSDNTAEKKFQNQKMQRMKSNANPQKTISQQYELLSAWYLPAILVCLGEEGISTQKNNFADRIASPNSESLYRRFN